MTSTTIDIIWLTLGSFAILVSMTFLGEVLRARQDSNANNPMLETYMTRVQSWWGMVAFIGLAMLIGKVGVTVLLAFDADHQSTGRPPVAGTCVFCGDPAAIYLCRDGMVGALCCVHSCLCVFAFADGVCPARRCS